VSPRRRHLALVGARCCGKSSVGRRLAELFGVPLIDLDEALVQAANASAGALRFQGAGEVLLQWGNDTFRNLESQVLRDVLEVRDPRVVATGGGAVLTPRNRALLAAHARTIWLRVEPEELARRLRGDTTFRPTLTGADPAAEMEAVLAARAPFYAEVADLPLDCGNRAPGELALEIQRWLLEGRAPGG